jgi:DNA topoisomerase-1
MAKYLVIVESPAKAKTIGRFLGKDYHIEASIGHIRDLPKSQIGVDIENDFEPKYISIRGKGDIIAKLRKNAKISEKVFLATDPDREGEAISWHLTKLLNIDEKNKCRISFNEITKTAVKGAIKSPRQIDMDLVDAQQARRVLDRIVGYKISPLLWRKVRKGLSAGRVQSVATRIICDREEEIDSFVEEEYWSIISKLSKHSQKAVFDAKFYGNEKEKIELKSKEQTDKILNDIEDAEYKVKKVKIGEKKRVPAPPFTTSTLQQEAARKLGFTTKKTMIVSQQLYEGVNIKGTGAVGLVTYIRTDSVRISTEAQIEAKNYITGKFGENYLSQGFRNFKNKSASQDAHEAIRPTHVTMTPVSIKASLSNEQFKLYKLIWDRFVASQMAIAVYDTVAVDLDAKGYIFKASGSNVKFDGFMAVYIEGHDENGEEKESKLPILAEGEILDFKSTEAKQHFTQPPLRYTEATLVKLMEEKGIGRPSTYSPTITTILARGYVEKEKKFLFPTELGKIVTDIMKNHFADVVDLQFTALMEKKLDDVEEGKKQWKEVIREFYGPFAEVLNLAEEKIGHIQLVDEVTDIICEKCGRNMVIKNGRFGKFLACPGFPDCRNTKAIVEEAGVNCPKCGGKVLIKKTKKKRKYLGCEKNPTCSFMSWDSALKENCPVCGNFLLKKLSNKKAIIKCSNDECEYQR